MLQLLNPSGAEGMKLENSVNTMATDTQVPDSI